MSVLLLLFFLPLYSSYLLDSIVTTSSGTIEGYVNLFTGAQIWQGIPFAAPPIALNRLKSPMKLEPWTGILETKTVKNMCVQTLFNGTDLGQEDCLYLDVYAPKTVTNETKLPVMVWIYGGGFTFGSANEFGWYDGSNLAIERDVIVVGINYRVGAFGLLALEELRNEDPNLSTGNYGLQDQTAALQWVQENIGKFGGDPNRVTLFGESAGAISICWHLVSPASAGLFHAAIMESGTCDAPEFFKPYSRSSKFGYEYAANIGCNRTLIIPEAEFLACLRSISSSEFNAGLKSNSFEPMLYPTMPFGMTIDGAFTGLMGIPLDLMKANKFNKVPVIAGTNADEGVIFVPDMPQIVKGVHYPLQSGDLLKIMQHFFNDSTADAILKQYPSSSGVTDDKRAAAILRDYMFSCSTRRFMRVLGDQGVPVWLYHFEYLNSWVDISMLGDYHTSEISFVFHNQWPSIVHSFSAIDDQMSDTFGFYWSNLAKFGTPNDNNSTSFEFWPVLNTASDINMAMNVPTRVSTELYKENCDFWDNTLY